MLVTNLKYAEIESVPLCHCDECKRQRKIDINVIADDCHAQALHMGWWHSIATGKPLDRNVPEMLCLIHSEISEAMEGYRKDKMDEHLPLRKSVEVELADAVIRIMDLTVAMGLDLGGAIADKLEYNASRADHSMAERQKDGGKKF